MKQEVREWVPIIRRSNYRVEVDFEGLPARGEAEAKSLARQVSELRGIRGYVIWDTEYECPNCHARYSHVQDLKGCCEASLRGGAALAKAKEAKS